ncbi:twin-arginine translocation signal domain-containing protein [Mesosutterella sp. OilRF-GAM-744-9]|uniref:Twin-arginine translocation signal domain-containing protein n=1 Tax=Mesosutterella porci TaxID=2915351 RepID=A0ABS9MPZ1_9BURK|nr:twin-arginine translocation signal domain-containing protein [Mesosutterella sp. oilRF-744-WT-GAM-9]MCG5030665.1 twin-arginine translocation signal domain-containing protein [Mesosutterella sp. oilRF-744-WT-GAM-9]
MAMQITRRGFLKGAAAGAAAAAAAPALAIDSEADLHWDRSADLVVIGYGNAGCNAAIEAARCGCFRSDS